jgi:hypothetical protein
LRRLSHAQFEMIPRLAVSLCEEERQASCILQLDISRGDLQGSPKAVRGIAVSTGRSQSTSQLHLGIDRRRLLAGQPLQLGYGLIDSLEPEQDLGPLLAGFDIIGLHAQSLGVVVLGLVEITLAGEDDREVDVGDLELGVNGDRSLEMSDGCPPRIVPRL